MNSLQAKNKSAKTGILVSLNSIELKVNRKKKTKARPKAGPSPLRAQSKEGSPDSTPFLRRLCTKNNPGGSHPRKLPANNQQLTTSNQGIQMNEPKQYQCRHIFTDGRRCGSPCLRGEDLCYYHHTTRKPVADAKTRKTRRSTFDLPLPEDQSAIQLSIGQVLQRIAANEIDPRRAGLLLYGLQIASLNLPKPTTTRNTQYRQQTTPQTVEEITLHPELGTLAPQSEITEPAERKSAVTLLMEEMQLEGDDEDKWPDPWQPETKPAILPNLQATEEESALSAPILVKPSSTPQNSPLTPRASIDPAHPSHVPFPPNRRQQHRPSATPRALAHIPKILIRKELHHEALTDPLCRSRHRADHNSLQQHARHSRRRRQGNSERRNPMEPGLRRERFRQDHRPLRRRCHPHGPRLSQHSQAKTPSGRLSPR